MPARVPERCIKHVGEGQIFAEFAYQDFADYSVGIDGMVAWMPNDDFDAGSYAERMIRNAKVSTKSPLQTRSSIPGI